MRKQTQILFSFKTSSFKFVLQFAVISLFTACAQIVAPTGGPKDTTPPKVEKEYPKNKSTSFTAKKIEIKFDEFIQLKDVENQLVISPPLEEKPIYEIKGKSLDIIVRSKLKPNTTYTFNFGNSIADNHEGNILGNYSYVFSTGSNIDTLSIKGTVKNAFDTKPEKELSACLYPVDSFTDSTIFHSKPFYFTKTNDQGSFVLTNLPNQSFKLVLFKDENKNLKYDKNETISFYDSLVKTTDTIPLNHLLSFKPNPYVINRLIDTLGKELGRFQFIVYKPTNVAIKPNQKVDYYTWYKKGKDNLDTITVFGSPWQHDSVWFTYQSLLADTSFYVKVRKSAKPTKFEAYIKKSLELNDSFTISFNQPFKTINTDTSKLLLKEDTIPVKPTLFYSPNKDYIKLYYPLKERTKYALEFKDSAFTDIYGNYNKGEKASFTTKTLKDYSTLLLSFIHPDDKRQYIAQLIDEAESKVFTEFVLQESKTINLEYIVPGKYKIKIIADVNKNGIWDNGDYQKHQQPETVYYYPQTLTMRAYWDLEQQIDLKKIVD